MPEIGACPKHPRLVSRSIEADLKLRKLLPISAQNYAVLAVLLTFFFGGQTGVCAQQSTTPNLKVAFIGDQALGPNAVAVLNLIKSEGAQAVLHSGDLDYTDNPSAWEQQINSVLGPDFPYFVTIGNHDELAWRGATGYQQFVISRFNRLGLTWSGDLGVQSTFRFRGLFFVLTPPGIGNGFDLGTSDSYIRDQLAADNSVWTICSWHKDQRLMQVGGKSDEAGWAVYEEARQGGAIIATAHEHSYSRTHLLSSMINQTVANASNTLALSKGNTLAFVSGLGGASIRDQLLGGNWWGSVLAANCLAGDPVCQTTTNPGALFGVFNADGQPNKAVFYFKDTSGRVTDSFTLISNVELPSISNISPASIEASGSSFILTVDGANFGSQTVVRWNGADKPTTLVSPTRLTATISAADITTAGTATVTVSSPGGTSSPTSFTITPARVIANITAVSPTAAEAGANAFALNIYGTNFLSNSLVRWNNVARPTTLVSPTQITAVISVADIANISAAQITVANPDGVSNAMAFTVGPPSINLFTETSDRAIALDSVTFVRDPFLLTTANNFSSDRRTRVMIFSPNLTLFPGDDFSRITARAEDSQHNLYPLAVEFAGQLRQPNTLMEIVFRLPDELSTSDSFWVTICYRNSASNKVLITTTRSNN